MAEAARYETKEEQSVRLGRQNVQRMQNFLSYNPYNLKNYRADNLRLPYSLPGEKFQLNKQLNPIAFEDLEERKLKNYLELINDDKVQLK